MAKKAKKKKHRLMMSPSPFIPNLTSQVSLHGIPQRRLPRPPEPHPEAFLLTSDIQAPSVSNPFAHEVAERIRRVCKISRLSPYVVMNDFITMFYWQLKYFGADQKSRVITGKKIQDPPQVAEIFRRARERYERTSLQYPATYREMEEAYSEMFVVLQMMVHEGSLEKYATSWTINPDIIGQIFVAVVQPGQDWWPFFPPWHVALSLARHTIPDGTKMVYDVIVRAGMKYKEAHPTDAVRLDPGENWEEWYTEVAPYLDPILIGPHLTTSSAMMLALATRFPDWARQRGLVNFYFGGDDTDSIIHLIVSINAMLYGLNSFYVELVREAFTIATFMDTYHHAEEHGGLVALDAAHGPAALIIDDLEPHAARRLTTPLPPPPRFEEGDLAETDSQSSFSALFKRK